MELAEQKKASPLKEDRHCLSDFSQLFETGIGQLNGSGMSCMKGRFEKCVQRGAILSRGFPWK